GSAGVECSVSQPGWNTAQGQGSDAVLLEAELLLKPPRPGLEARARPDVVAVVPLLLRRCAAHRAAGDVAGGVREIGVATLYAEVDRAGAAEKRKQLCLCVRRAERHGERDTGA